MSRWTNEDLWYFFEHSLNNFNGNSKECYFKITYLIYNLISTISQSFPYLLKILKNLIKTHSLMHICHDHARGY